MEKIKVGASDLHVARINLGGNVFGWTLDEQQSFDILDAFFDKGFNFIDTADTYAWWVNGTGGQSETIIGRWLRSRGNRDKVIIATKVGSQTKEHPADISRRHILRSVDESLQRLQTDRIDLYYTHYDDDKTPVEETLGAYDEVIRAGKVRYIAASNVSPVRLAESFRISEQNGLPKYVALQPHYNLMERSTYEKDYAPIAEQHGLTVFPYWALAAGFLTGKYRSDSDLSKSVRGKGVQKYLTPLGLAVLNALDEIAKKHRTTVATVALAWLLAKRQIGAPVVSATSRQQLAEVLAAADLRLDKEDLEKLDTVSQL